MKNILSGLSPREKNTVFAGVIMALLLLLIACWQLLSTRINQLEQQLKQNQALLIWIKEADRRLQQPSRRQNASSAMRPAAIQSALEKAQMTTRIAKLQQNEKGAIELALTQVRFDRLLKLLDDIQKNTGAVPVQIHIKRGASAGNVSADMLLQAE